MHRLLACLLLLATLVGCSTIAEVTSPITEPLGRALLSPEEERRLGDQLAAEVRRKEQVLDNPAVQSYVDRVGSQLVAATEGQPRFDYTFTVLDNPDQVNAFALPGGHIFIYSGLLRAADSEAELAAVLAHELAHVTEGHISELLAAQVGAQQLQQLVLGKNPGLVAQLASQIATTGYIAAHTREAEREADSSGLDYLAGAQYEPAAMVRFFQELARMGNTQPGFVGKFLSTHPAPGERAERVQGLIRERTYGPGRKAVVGGFEQIQAQLGAPAVSVRGGAGGR